VDHRCRAILHAGVIAAGDNMAKRLNRTSAFGALLLVWAAAPASAGCHAADFTVSQFLAAMRDVNAASEHLNALQVTPGLPVREQGLLAIAVQMTDRSAREVSLFGGYLTIYSRLIHADDRSVTDDFIEFFAPTTWKALKNNADHLTVIAADVPRFGTEVREASDQVRKLQGIFACAM
jgi:hypothetical protein